ncbi:hypothetical protein CHS0354_022287 [Potamilus streckersoni]|uniref:Disease resistance R13L4/SHOC-2-like LRR domain-containing protein n=1 Tax=Potamilus streckersoni TaxID=2493646 RepID=A0AAE0THU1_9BIVA|nr:hypothetical protein CHS0354_022287 [Potamilus streckersoni]
MKTTNKNPQDIWKLSDLIELCLQNNEITELPDSIGDLHNLEILDVRDNHLTALPGRVGNITSLKKLQISSNKIKKLPKEIGNLKNLTTLEALKNELSYIPLQLASCENLTILSLDRNFLQTLPRQICQLRSLTEVTACANRLISLPQTIGEMMSLKSLYVDNNPSLMSLPASTFSRQIGFNSCATVEPSHDVIEKLCTVCVRRTKSDLSTIVLPPEIRSVGDLGKNNIPSLLELSFRTAYQNQNQTGKIDVELPRYLEDLLSVPTGHCQCCRQKVFVMAFPVVFHAQIKNSGLFLLGLCCSTKCVRTTSLQVKFPLLYPYPEDLSLAIVPIN